MPTLRCPYCAATYPSGDGARCPACGRVAVLPRSLRKTTFRERQRMRERIYRDADRQRRGTVLKDARFGRRPAVLGFAIIGLLVLGALLVGNANRGQPAEGQRVSLEDRALRDMTTLCIALERFRADTGRYPTEEEGLRALVINPGVRGWGRNYVNLVRPDPWRTPYLYSLTSAGPQVRSSGPDRQPFTADDITLPSPVDADVPAGGADHPGENHIPTMGDGAAGDSGTGVAGD